MAATRAFLLAASLCSFGLAQDKSFDTFADVVAYINCDRAQRGIEKLKWSQKLADDASKNPANIKLLTQRWSVAWSGADMLENFTSHFLASESVYDGGAMRSSRSDFLAMVWVSATTIGCSTTSSGYVCVLETSRYNLFFRTNRRRETPVRPRYIMETAACSEDRLCPTHGDGEKKACTDAGCSYQLGYIGWCARPNKTEDMNEVRVTFAGMLADLNCERKKRGSYGAIWSDRNVDWAFKLRAADNESEYEHAFVRGTRSWDFTWSGDNVRESFYAFFKEAQSAYESPSPNTSSLKYDFLALMSSRVIVIGCYKAGESNACVIRMFQPVKEDFELDAPKNVGCPRGGQDIERADDRNLEGPFAGVVDDINCARSRRMSDKLQWSEELAELASSAPAPGFAGPATRWSVGWDGSDPLDSFGDFLDDMESTAAAGDAPEDFKAIIWRSGSKVGCGMTMNGDYAYVCVFETLNHAPFFDREVVQLRPPLLTEQAACSQDSLCPVHREDSESACIAASCSWDSRWVTCGRPNKAQDASSVRATFADVLAALNCERKRRGAYAAYWSDGNVDWAFKLRAADTPSNYEHAFAVGGGSWDFAWSGDNALDSFNSFLQAAQSAYENPTPETSSLKHDYVALMSKGAIFVGCYKDGKSNACVLRTHTPVAADAQVGQPSGSGCDEDSRSATAIEAPFAGVVDHVNCARARRFDDKLEWSEELASLASSAPNPGFVGDETSRWSVTWSGDDLLAGFTDHFRNSESTYTGQTTSTTQEDFMVMVWSSAKKIGCDVTIAGGDAYVCVVEGLPQMPFLGKNDTQIRELTLTEKAACSPKDRLCPIHGENDESACIAASCSWESGWTWCERPNKEKDSMKKTFEDMLATLNCERKQRGIGAVFWDERNADWAFKLRAEEKTSEYEYAFLRGTLRDFAWSANDAVKGFDIFFKEIESAYKKPKGQTSSMSEIFMALMSESAIKVGCYKSGKSNACVMRFSTPFTADAATAIAQPGGGDCAKEIRDKLRSVETNSDSDSDLDMMDDNGSCRVCGIGSMIVFILIGAMEMHKL